MAFNILKFNKSLDSILILSYLEGDMNQFDINSGNFINDYRNEQKWKKDNWFSQ